MLRHLIFSCFISLSCCQNNEEDSAWHSGWINSEEGEVFHSEIFLKPAGITPITIQANSEIRVGFFVEKGLEICKSDGIIYMGPADAPHAFGASPGGSTLYDPKDGEIKLLLENASTIPTNIAIYTVR